MQGNSSGDSASESFASCSKPRSSGRTQAERARLLAGAARLSEPVFTDVAAAEETGDVAFATLHGLYWLVVNIAERGPLILAVDDAQWADEPSLRFLLHLANRLAGLPVVVALTVRAGADMHRPHLSSLLLEARPPILRPRPLSESAVGQVVRASMGEDASAELCRACTHATGGNPFLLFELLGEFRREGHPASEIDPEAVGRVAPERVAAAVLLRVSRLHPQATALARSVAVLGEQARLRCARSWPEWIPEPRQPGDRPRRPRGSGSGRAVALRTPDRSDRDL